MINHVKCYYKLEEKKIYSWENISLLYKYLVLLWFYSRKATLLIFGF